MIIRRCNQFLVICILFSFSCVVHASEKLEADLIARIAKSTTELTALERKISLERSRIAGQLDTKQQELKGLRKDAATLQRMADEQLLGLDQLKERVNQWTTQNNYQKYLLTSYVEGANLSVDRLEKIDGEPVFNATTIELALTQIEQALLPAWQEQTVISPAGDILNVSVLKTGPIEVAIDAQRGIGGPLVRALANEPRILPIFDRTAVSELGSLIQTGSGQLRFDPTLGNALQLLEGKDSFVSYIDKGGVWALPILFFGALSLFIAVLKSSQFLRLPKVDEDLANKLNRVIAEPGGKDPARSGELKQKLKLIVRDAGSAQQKLIQIALSTPVSQQRDDLLVAYLMEYKHKLERYMGVVATSASVAPLLGLLGTVSGMITTFKLMTIFGSGDAATVSGGISEALITTELGLIVAIPSLLVSALLIRKARSYSHKLENFAIKLSKLNFS